MRIPERSRRYLGESKLSFFDFLPSGIYLGSSLHHHHSRNPFNIDESDENVECSSAMSRLTRQQSKQQQQSPSSGSINLGNVDLLDDSFDSASSEINDNNSDEHYLSMMQSDVFDSFCSSLHCDVGPMSKDESVVVRLRFRLWSRSLAPVSSHSFISLT